MAVEWKRLAYADELLGLNRLSDPGEDRIVFWDESEGALKWLSPGTNLTISGTDLNASGGGSVPNPLYLGTNDAEYGLLGLYGNGAVSGQGGRLALYTAADYDSTIDYYVVQVTLEDFYIGPVTDQDALKLTSAKDLYLTDGDLYVQAGSITRATIVAGTTTATLSLGANDTAKGILNLYGYPTGYSDGGRIDLYLCADHDATFNAYRIQPYGDRLQIGPDTDPDALELKASKDLYLTDGSLYVQEAGITRVSLSANPTSGWINVGVADSVAGGITVHGAGASSVGGGRLELGVSADHDDTINEYVLATYQDDLHIGIASYPDLLKLTAEMDLHLRSGSIVLPASEYVNFGGTQGSSSYGIRDNSGVIEHKNSGASWIPMKSYVTRGDISNWDYANSGLTADSAWHSVDLSSIIPAGATMVHLGLVISSGGAHHFFQIKDANYTNGFNGAILCTQVAGIQNYAAYLVPCNSSRIFTYYITSGATYYLAVLGWII